MVIKSKALFAELILKWYKRNGRDFPWRHKTDPYQILIAEIMLQRTRAEQVVPVYLDFIREFPTIEKLDSAPIERIKQYFERLGLLWRATRLKELAREISKLNWKIPSDRKELLRLPAIGEYMADAVLAFAYDENASVVDSNVVRVIGRVFGLDGNKEARRKLVFKETLKDILPKNATKAFNWAIIDLAALVCLPRNPLCKSCPLNTICDYAALSKFR